MSKRKIIIFHGPSGSGKTTAEFKAHEIGIQSAVSHTTRAIRPGEVEGVNYHFCTVDDLLNLDRLNTIKITDDWYYGVSKKELEKPCDLIYSVINIEFAKELIDNLNGEREVIIVWFNPNKEQRIKLLTDRGETLEDIEIRLAREDNEETHNSLGLKADYIVTEVSDKAQNELLEYLNDRRN